MKCPVCSNRSNFKTLSPSFCQAENYLCNKCGLVFISERDSSIGQYYKRDGYFKKSPNIAYKKQFVSKSLLIKEARERVANALKILPVNFEGKRVLDVGCGYGEILYSLKQEYGSRVVGIEASSEASLYGSRLFSVPIHAAVFEEFSPEEKFDVVWCSHVLEHTSNPNFFLRKIKTCLHHKGYLYLEVPNILSPSGGFSLNMFLYDEHLQTFSAYNLYLILKKNGFRVVGYSDSGFLKLWCKLSNGSGMKPPEINSGKVLSFLERYKKEYSVLSSIKVYTRKMLYGCRLVFYKARDVF